MVEQRVADDVRRVVNDPVARLRQVPDADVLAESRTVVGDARNGKVVPVPPQDERRSGSRS